MKINLQIEQLIEKEYFVTKITNETPYDCILQLRPAFPKRKYVDMLLVKNDTYIIIDNKPLDLTEICVTFKHP